MTGDGAFSREGDGDWIRRTAFWCRAVAVVGLAATVVILIFTEWDITSEPQSYLTAMFAGNSVVYLVLSFFVRRLGGKVCLFLVFFAAVDGVLNLLSPLLLLAGSNGDALARFFLYGYLVVALGIAGAKWNLAVSAYWAWRMLREHPTMAGRGFEVVMGQSDQPMVSERGK